MDRRNPSGLSQRHLIMSHPAPLFAREAASSHISRTRAWECAPPPAPTTTRTNQAALCFKTQHIEDKMHNTFDAHFVFGMSMP